MDKQTNIILPRMQCLHLTPSSAHQFSLKLRQKLCFSRWRNRLIWNYNKHSYSMFYFSLFCLTSISFAKLAHLRTNAVWIPRDWNHSISCLFVMTVHQLFLSGFVEAFLIDSWLCLVVPRRSPCYRRRQKGSNRFLVHWLQSSIH